MPVIVLLRHGISSANTAGILAGHSPGVSLTDQGVRALQETLQMLPRQHFSLMMHSPLLRCEETARIAASIVDVDRIEASPEIVELDYGDWTGRSLKELSALDEWKLVLEHASQVRFPGGESIAEAAARSVSRVRDVVASLSETERSREGSEPEWAMIISHGDIIKAVIAEALGLPLDEFQRLSVAPGSFTVIDYGGPRPVMTAMSVTAAGLSEANKPGGGGMR